MKPAAATLAAAMALMMVAPARAGDREAMKLKKWAFMKAMEGCVGEEAAKMHMVKIKTAVAQCMDVDAPELELPIFKAPYRAVGALVDAAYRPVQHEPAFFFAAAGGHHRRPRPGTAAMMQPDSGSDLMISKAMKKAFWRRLIERMVADEFLEDLDVDDVDDMDMGGSADSLMRFFQQQQQQPLSAVARRRMRYRRQSDSDYSAAAAATEQKKEMFELGDRLNAKLQAAKGKMEGEIGNMTCVLRKCGVIDAEDNLRSPRDILAEFEDYPLPGDDKPDRWLRTQFENDVELCHAYAEAIPSEVVEQCPYGAKLGRVKAFKKCLKMKQVRTCMSFDVKRKLERNLGGTTLADLVETTQMEESELLPLVMTLLQGPEADM